MEPITLAVLSDLHCGTGSRAKDLCPHPGHEALDDNYKRQFLAFLRRKHLKANFLILPGDVSHKADASEFRLAGDVVSEIAAALTIPVDRIAFVPGNHDIDWSRLQLADPPEVRQELKYFNLRRSPYFSDILQRSPRHVLDQPFLSVWEANDILVVGYNSAWHDEQGKSPHHGLIAAEHLQQLEECIERLNLGPERLRLFLVHHHPIQYSDPLPDTPDFSAMTNAGNLLALLHRYKFDMLIHGHKHKPNFETHSVDGAFPLAVLCAGSFSAHLDPRWSGYVNNQFHLVHAEARDEQSEVARGMVESWTYLCGHGWVPSQETNGIRHKVPFGMYTQPNELLRLVRPIIEEMLRARDYAEWSGVVARLPQLSHLPPRRVIEVVDALAPLLGFRRHGHSPEEIILLKPER